MQVERKFYKRKLKHDALDSTFHETIQSPRSLLHTFPILVGLAS